MYRRLCWPLLMREVDTGCLSPAVSGALALSSGKVSEEPLASMQVYELSTIFYNEAHDNNQLN